MERMVKQLTIALCVLSIFISMQSARAQRSPAQVSGKIAGADGHPVAGATVSLVNAGDSVIVKTTISATDGSFLFGALAPNTYKVQISMTGYQNYHSEPIQVREQNSLKLPLITIAPVNKTLKEVEITAQKKYIEQKPDRTVVNVNALISNNGANALEVLQNTPGVTVDESGTISFKGKSSVLVLIDDKPTYLSTASLANYLRSLPSSALDKIELMDNPPARYDAAGNAGVINIKTKKNTIHGLNGNASVGYSQGFYARTTENLTMNYRVNKMNFFTNLSYNYNRSYRRLEIDRSYLDNSGHAASYLEDVSYFRPRYQNVNVKLGADYYLSQKTTWGIVFTGSLQPNRDQSPVISTVFNANHEVDSTVNSINTSHNTFHSGAVNVNYTHKYDSLGKTLTFDADYVRYVAGSEQSFFNNAYASGGSLKSSETITDDLPSYINIYAAKTDLSLPFKNKAEFDAGLKVSEVRADNAANYFNIIGNVSTPDYNNTNRFIYKENINAAYVNYNKQWKRFGMQSGLRLENTNGSGHQLGNIVVPDSSFTNHYTNLFPTAYLSYKLDSSGNNTLVLSYGRRIGRPNYGSLNPFVFFVDKFTYFAGNPFLKPQFTNNYKLAYSYKSLLTVSVLYNYTAGVQSETIRPSGSVFISTTGNIGALKSIDLSLNLNLKPVKWWTLNFYAEVYNNTFSGAFVNGYLNQSVNSFSGNANNQFQFAKGWSAELSGYYRSRQAYGQFVIYPQGAVNVGVQKKLWQSKGSVRFNVRDVFHTSSSAGQITSIPGAESSFHNWFDSRVATLTLSFNFGKALNNPSKRQTGSADSEQGRAH
jgi:hypothetical protein